MSQNISQNVQITWTWWFKYPVQHVNATDCGDFGSCEDASMHPWNSQNQRTRISECSQHWNSACRRFPDYHSATSHSSFKAREKNNPAGEGQISQALSGKTIKPEKQQQQQQQPQQKLVSPEREERALGEVKCSSTAPTNHWPLLAM